MLPFPELNILNKYVNIDLENLAYLSNTEWQQNFTDSNGIRTHNHLVSKQTLNHLAKLPSCQLPLNHLAT